jgi:hypothetical protein
VSLSIHTGCRFLEYLIRLRNGRQNPFIQNFGVPAKTATLLRQNPHRALSFPAGRPVQFQLPQLAEIERRNFEFDNSQKNKLRAIENFAGLERRFLTVSPPNQEKLQENTL